MVEDIVLPKAYSLRYAYKNDDAFVFALFCSAKTELSLLPLSPQQRELLVQQQYRLQQAGYAAQYPQAVTLIIEYQSIPIGKIMLNPSANGVHIVDFVIAPQFRGYGYGSVILDSVKAYAQAKEASVSLNVDRQNMRAKQLYLRLGFFPFEISPTQEWLSWPSP